MTANRRPLFVANWKMHKTASEARSYVAALAPWLARPLSGSIVLAPPYTALETVAGALKQARVFGPVALAAQNVHPLSDGAYTGEVSIPMVRELGCTYVIVGHSERRILFGESDAWVGEKTRAVLSGGLCPILCVGERLDEREAGLTESVVLRQLETAVKGIEPAGELVVAYEPVWAIGTGRHAKPVDAGSVHDAIRCKLKSLLGETAASRVRILYGGSVTPENINSFMKEKEIDGALVGGASLDPERFFTLIHNGLEAGESG